MKRFRNLLIATLCIGILLCLVACGQTTETTPSDADQTSDAAKDNPIVEFRFSTGDVVTVELYPDEAPITVQNFLTYVRENFYVGTVIHRVESIVVQGGGMTIKNGALVDKATHDPIKGEFSSNGVNNRVSHTAGTISMARSSINSATSQFFFCPVDYPYWDGDYAAFGHVVDQSSLDAIVRLSKVKTDGSNRPVSDIIIRSVRIISE